MGGDFFTVDSHSQFPVDLELMGKPVVDPSSIANCAGVSLQRDNRAPTHSLTVPHTHTWLGLGLGLGPRVRARA